MGSIETRGSAPRVNSTVQAPLFHGEGEHVRDDGRRVGGAVARREPHVEALEHAEEPVELRELEAELRRDRGTLIPAELHEEVLEQPAQQRVVPVLRVELEEQRLHGAAGADAGGLQLLELADRLTEQGVAALDPGEGQVGGDGELTQLLVERLEQAPVGETPDQEACPDAEVPGHGAASSWRRSESVSDSPGSSCAWRRAW